MASQVRINQFDTKFSKIPMNLEKGVVFASGV